MNYIIRDRPTLAIKRAGAPTLTGDAKLFTGASLEFNALIDQFEAFGVDVFPLLGMRNLSAFIGELYGAVVIKGSANFFRKNPHQDGYPDLLPMDEAGATLWKSLELRLRDKTPFSPFATGGIEIKATCGSVPTPAVMAKKNLQKPHIGDQRIEVMQSYDWKAHHRDTNNLLGIIWDFIERKPRIVAAFYSDRLTVDDWGEIIHPKDGGGRTTSVSIMTRGGIRKMYEDWLFVLDDPRYIKFIDARNRGTLLMDYSKASSRLPVRSKATRS